MATLLSAATDNGAGTGASHTGPCTVHVANDSVFDGAEIYIEIADSDTAGEYAPVGKDGVFRAAGSVTIDAKGTYFLRAKVARAGTNTSLNCTTTQ